MCVPAALLLWVSVFERNTQHLCTASTYAPTASFLGVNMRELHSLQSYQVSLRHEPVSTRIYSSFKSSGTVKYALTTRCRRNTSCRSMLNNSAILGGGAEVFRFLHVPKTGGANIENFLGLKHQTHKRLALQQDDNRVGMFWFALTFLMY